MIDSTNIGKGDFFPRTARNTEEILPRVVQVNMVDAPQEHQIILPGIEIAFNHTTKTVFMLDQTGADNTDPLRDLDEWFEKIGYHLHCIKIAPPAPGETLPRRPDEEDTRA